MNKLLRIASLAAITASLFILPSPSAEADTRIESTIPELSDDLYEGIFCLGATSGLQLIAIEAKQFDSLNASELATNRWKVYVGQNYKSYTPAQMERVQEEILIMFVEDRSKLIDLSIACVKEVLPQAYNLFQESRHNLPR